MISRSGSIYVREPDHMLETGAVVAGHCHAFDHTTFFLAGLWQVTGDNGLKVIIRGGTPGARLLIKADVKHELKCLQGPGCYACVYSHRTPAGDVTPEYTGWDAAYGVQA